MITELLKMSACEVVDALKRGEITSSDILSDLENRHLEIDPVVNALPTTCFDRAFKQAMNLEQQLAKKTSKKNQTLHGLPIPIKDSYRVEGVRTTFGSKAYEHYKPEASDVIVDIIEKAGGIVFAKSNTPEFEAGASTFNDVFGYTRNPRDLSRSVGGSSGGAAAAVASGMAYIAQGSDFACSLRFPASFCGIVGLRPTPGVVPQGPNKMPFQALSVLGPLGRSVADVGLGLDAFTGFDFRDPLSNPNSNKTNFRSAAEKPTAVHEFAYSDDLGLSVVSSEVKEVVSDAIRTLEGNGCKVNREFPDLEGSTFIFDTLRAFQFATLWGEATIEKRSILKPEVSWNIDRGLNLDLADLILAERMRSDIRLRMIEFLRSHKFLITPTAPVVPPYFEERYVKSIEGIEFDTYIDWLSLGYIISITGCPAISLPCGVNADGLPVGMQIIAAPNREAELLQFAAWIESLFALGFDKPADNLDRQIIV